MAKFFVSDNQIDNVKNEITIVGRDVNHIANVLRLPAGSEIQVCNIDNNNNYVTKIIDISNNNITCEILEQIKSVAESNVHITIFQGLPKFDKMEYIIQKCVELGVHDITPVQMKRCVVKLDEKLAAKKIERWQKISETAAKQSGRDIVPKVNNALNIKNICNLIANYDIVLLAYEEEEVNTLKKELKRISADEHSSPLRIGVIIGPEGGIEREEVEILKKSGSKIITLGKRILRTETVGIVVSSIIMYELDS